jgi:hypothetical protein
MTASQGSKTCQPQPIAIVALARLSRKPSRGALGSRAKERCSLPLQIVALNATQRTKK